MSAKASISSHKSDAAQFEINASDIEFGNRIAVGGFAEVFIGSFEGTLVAIKKLLDQDFDPASVERFVSSLSQMQYPSDFGPAVVLVSFGTCTAGCDWDFSSLYKFT